MKRIFIAIELPEKIKQNLAKVQESLKDLDARWVKPEHMHLTLVFLGDVEEDKILEIEKVCQKVAQNFQPFEINFEGLGAFPNPKRAHNFWVGIKNSEQQIKLQKELALALRDLGFGIEDRGFMPHLTIARFRRKENLKNQLERYQDKNFGKMKVSEFFIFESELRPDGPKHKIIKKLNIE